MLSCAKRAAGVKKGCIVLSIHKKTALATSMLVASAFSGLVLVLQIMTCTRWSILMVMVKLNQVGYLIVIHILVRSLLCPLYLHLTTQATGLMIIPKVSMCQWKFMEILTIPMLYKKATRVILLVLLCSKTPIRQIRQARKKRLPIMKCLATSLTGISGSMAHTTICEV